MLRECLSRWPCRLTTMAAIVVLTVGSYACAQTTWTCTGTCGGTEVGPVTCPLNESPSCPRCTLDCNSNPPSISC